MTDPTEPPAHGAPIELVIFDCDGVLVDSERLAHGVLQQVLAEHGVLLDFEQTVRRFVGSSLAATHQRIAALLGLQQLPDGFAAALVERTKQAFRDNLTTVPGAPELLDVLAVPCCVASNGNRAKVDFTLGLTGLAHRFAGRIFTADDVTRPKPAPDLFLHAAACMGAAPARTVVVEDTPTGVGAARAAGMAVIGFAAMTPADDLRCAGADVVVASMAELRLRLPVQAGG